MESNYFGKGLMRSFEILNPAKSTDFWQNLNFFGLRIIPASPTFDKKSIVRHQ